MFGYATNETPELMPVPISLAHKLTRRLSEVRKSGLMSVPAAGRQEPGDGGVRRQPEAGAGGRGGDLDPARGDVGNEELRADILKHVIQAVIPAKLLDAGTKYHINPTGRFVIGGPMGDTGLTGRKIIVDTYGGMGRHGGGAFSGKDPTKVDRSAAYMARYVAKNIVAAGLAERCEVQLAYAIGVAEPVERAGGHLRHGQGGRGQAGRRWCGANFALTPKAIIESLNLRRPIYKATAAYGHFGREGQGLHLGGDGQGRGTQGRRGRGGRCQVKRFRGKSCGRTLSSPSVFRGR